jgi:penicillin-binding protein-related factor A (putative recombinase)
MSVRTWKSAEEEFASWWWKKSSYCFQFHDTRAAMGATGSRRVFTTAHPSDFLVTDEGVMFYAEVKSSENPVSFPFTNVKPSQWNAARQQVAAGGNYFFFLFSLSNKVWYRIPGSYLVPLKEQGIKSVKWAELLDFLWTPPQ